MIHEQYRSIITDPVRAQEIVARILKEGCVTLPDFFAPDAWSAFHAFAHDPQNVNQRKGTALQGTPVYEFGYSEETLAFCQAIHGARCVLTDEKRRILKKEKQVVGTPYKDARNTRANEVTAYHYDGAYVNLTIPLILPSDPDTDGGNLVLFPNLRRRYSGIVCKILSRLLRHSSWLRKKFGYSTVPYTVGALNLFFGDLSFHGVEPLRGGERLVITVNSHW